VATMMDGWPSLISHKVASEAGDVTMAELYEYSGYLTFTTLPEEQLQQVRYLTDQSGKVVQNV
jgi:hypothetical protein